MKRTSSFRRQFILALILTFILSLVCTAAIWGASLYYLLSDEFSLRPANYYEQKIPQIIQFANQNHDKLLSPSFKPELEQIIPLEGINYQVVDLSGQIIYGWEGRRFLSEPGDIIRKLNTSEQLDGFFIRYFPILDQEDRLSGVFVLRYALSLLYSNQPFPAKLLLFIFGNMAAPFLFILVFTILFARRIGKRLEPPIAKLIDGAERIRQNDLDFTLSDVGGSKEMTELASAFEDMRRALHTSLTAQWQMDQERRDMVAAIAHDLRTPLTIIQGHVDNLLESKEKQAERLDKYLHTIRKSTERAVRLLDEMNLVSEIDRPDFILTKQSIDLMAFCQEKAEEYQMMSAVKRIDFQSAFCKSEDDPGRIDADVHRLEQMMDNVVANSIRFTPEGGQIRWRINIGPETAVIETADSGPGFTEADLRYLFEKFYQGDPSRSKAKGHAGLGLYIVKTLAEKHGGSVAAGNRPEGGAYVRIILKVQHPTFSSESVKSINK